MQLFRADATIFLNQILFAHENIKKHPQKLLIIGLEHFSQYRPGCSNGPKTEIPYHQKPLNAGLGI